MNPDSNFFLSGIIKRFEDKNAIIEIDNQEIYWPVIKLPEDAKKNSEVRIFISTNENDKLERQKIAKEMLNEILNTDNGEKT